jgi:hypothetical protein
MSSEVVIALIAAFASVVVSVITAVLTYLTKRRTDADLAQLNHSFTLARSERDAQRDYEYEARKRLYAELQPLMFQLVERCNRSFERIQAVASWAREDKMDRFDKMWEDDPYPMISTVWDLISPLVLVRLSQTKLTFVDLTTDSFVRSQYVLARALYDIWTRGNELADVRPVLEYDDTVGETRQHILPGHLDRLLDEMILGEAGGYQYSMSFGAFSEAVLKKDSRLRDCSQRVIWVLTDFHPTHKQVLWRLLIANAHICQALIKTSTSDTAVHPLDALSPDDYDKFDWRRSNDGASHEEAIEIPFAAARRYLTNYVRI